MRQRYLVFSLLVVVLCGTGLVVYLFQPLSFEDMMKQAALQKTAILRLSKGTPEHTQALQDLDVIYQTMLRDFPESACQQEVMLAQARAKDQLAEAVEESIVLYEAWLTRFPDSEKISDVLFRLSQLYLLPGLSGKPRYLKSLEFLERLIRDFPKHAIAPEAAFQTARIMEEIYEYDRAIQTYRIFCEQYPEHPRAAEALTRIGMIYSEKLKKYEEAQEAFIEVEQGYPDSPWQKTAQSMGQDARAKGAKAEAETYLDEHYGGRDNDAAAQFRTPTPADLLSDILAQELDLVHVAGQMDIAPAEGILSVSLELEIQNGLQTKDAMLFQINPALETHSVQINGKPATWQKEESILTIEPESPVAAHETFRIAYQASGSFQEAGESPYGVLLEEEAGYGLWGGLLFPFTGLGDLFTYDLHFILPDGYRVASGGAPQGEKETHWVAETPMLGICFSYGKFDLVQRKVGEHQLRIFLSGENKQKAADHLKKLEDIFLFYQDIFGPLPYPVLTITPWQSGEIIGGVSPHGLLFISEVALWGDRNIESLLAHELSHQWWGNLLPGSLIGDYSPWMSEGFATYSDALYLEHCYGRKRMDAHLAAMGNLYFEQVLQRYDQAVIKCWWTSPLYRPVVYEKGARMLHLLRGAMGDAAFFQALQSYVETYRFQAISAENFIAHCAETSGAPLDWFLEDWLKKPGYVRLVLSDVVVSDNAVEFTVIQKAGTFRMPLEIKISCQQETLTQRVFLNQPEERFQFDLPFRPDQIVLDPDNWLLRVHDPDDTWSVKP